MYYELRTPDLLKPNACHPNLGEMRDSPTTNSRLQYTAPHGARRSSAPNKLKKNIGIINVYL